MPRTRKRHRLSIKADRTPTAIAGLVLALALAACAPAASSPSPSSSSLIEAVCEQAIVVECAVDPQLIVVTVSGEAPDDETLQLARDLHEAATEAAPTEGAQLRRAAGDAPTLDPEYSTPAPWDLAIYPANLDEVESQLTSILAVEDVPGTAGIGSSGGWPYVTITSPDVFDAAFDAVSKLPLFAEGGTYTLLSLDEHLRIVHTPKWVTDAGIHEAAAIAAAYPQAEVLLEAPTGGAQPPTLYVARLTPEEVTALDARLSDPALAGFSVTGDPIEYVLSSLGADGTTYTGGLIGQPTD